MKKDRVGAELLSTLPTSSNQRSRESDYLIRIEPLKKMIECTLISPYIKNDKPISLLIVARAPRPTSKNDNNLRFLRFIIVNKTNDLSDTPGKLV